MIRELNGDPLIVRMDLPSGGTDAFYASRHLAEMSVFQFLAARRKWRAEWFRRYLATAASNVRDAQVTHDPTEEERPAAESAR